MTSSARLAMVFTMAIFFSTSSMAACGGGGWKKQDDARLAPADKPLLVDDANVGLDSQSFDIISGRLHLDSKQADAIVETISGIREIIASKRRALEELRDKFRKCEGKCAEELAKVKSATEELKKYDAYKEFETKLVTILDAEQYKTYLSLHQQQAQQKT